MPLSTSSSRSSPPNRWGWAWACPFAAPSSKRTVGASGPRPTRVAERSSASPCRPCSKGSSPRMTAALVHVIDDDEAVRVSLGYRLEMDELPYRTYGSPLEFLAIAEGLTCGGFGSDVRMPEMIGLVLVRELRERGCGLP